MSAIYSLFIDLYIEHTALYWLSLVSIYILLDIKIYNYIDENTNIYRFVFPEASC